MKGYVKGLIIVGIVVLVCAFAALTMSSLLRKSHAPAPIPPPPAPVAPAPQPTPAPAPTPASTTPAAGPDGEIKLEQPAMGTMVQYIVLGLDPAAAQAAIHAAMDEVSRLEALMSDSLPASDVSRINQSAGGPPVPVSAEVYQVIERALEVSKLSGGAFDITVGAFKGVWVIRPEAPRVPSNSEIQATLPLVSYHNVILDPVRKAVGLKLPKMRLDLGGIAKGYIIDAAVAVLQKKGVKMASVNAGGNIRLIGMHGNRPWNVGVQDPRADKAIIAWIKLGDMSIASSGDYEKFIKVNGQSFCHILDPLTGVPVANMRSATIITPEAWRADGLSTAVFVLGPEKGMALIESLPDVEGVIIDASGKHTESSGLKGRLNWVE